MFDLELIGAGLSLSQDIGRLPALLGPDNRLVVEAPPGTGKTTLVPPAVYNCVQGKVVVVTPRRVAVRAAWSRLRELSGQPVGFTVRGASERSDLVEFVTPGVLLRRLLRDPELAGVSAVVLDEVHERGLDTDLLLAMLRELQLLRDDLALIAMSATLDAARFCSYLDAPLLSTPAVQHPLDVSYQPIPGRLAGKREFYQQLGKLATRELQSGLGSVLVFVPGVREIDLVLQACDGLPLHGRLSLTEQDHALYSPGPRIVVSTPVAESSVTVPGVRCVIDSGLARVPKRDRARGMTGLVTESIAQSSANQRAGRAGREGPGQVIRAYSQAEYDAFRPTTTPEIQSADLTGALLTLQAWGSPDIELLDPPLPQAIKEAEETLAELGNPGPELAEFPLPPRLAHALTTAGSQAASTIAALADQPGGDITTTQPSPRETKRLAQLVSLAPRELSPGQVTALAYPRWVAKKMGETYQLASGTRATLGFPELQDAEWIACADVSRTAKGAIIRAAARLTEQEALEIIGTHEALEATVAQGKVQGRKVVRAGAIVLSSTPVKLEQDQVKQALIEAVRNGTELPETPAATELKHRLNFLHQQLGEPWPDVSWPELAKDPEEWLSGPELTKDDLDKLLPWPEAAQLGELAPQQIEVPSGSHPKIHYDTGRPTTRVKLQECFGLAESPSISGVRVQFHLLSPAGRPLAVTDDLSSFWAGPYQGVRADMRGRYPKHPWPEDPWTATATAKTKNRS